MSESNRYEWPFRIAMGLYLLAAVGLVVGAIAVSTKEVPVSAYVQTAQVLRAGQPNAARGVVLDGETGRFLVGADVALSSDGEPFAGGQSERHGHVHLQFQPPKTGGEIQFEARHSRLEEPYRLPAKIEVQSAKSPAWPTPTHRSAEPWEPHTDEWSGDVVVDLYPETDIVRGLPDVVLLRLTDAASGAPVKGEVKITSVEGMVEGELPRDHVSDSLGLIRIELTAMTRQLWTIEARKTGVENAPVSIGKVGIDTAPAQYSLRLMRPYAAPGDIVEGAVDSLHRTGGLMVDLYDPDDWVAAAAFGLDNDRSGVRVRIPENDSTPFYRVQVYGNVFGVDTAWDADYVAVAPEPGLTGCRIALERVLSKLASEEDDWKSWLDGARPILAQMTTHAACIRTLDSILLAVPRHFSPPQQLVNSQQTEREELERWKEEVRDDLVLLLGFVLAGGLLVVVFLVLRGLAENRRQQAMIDAVDLEFDSEDRVPVSRYEEYLDYARMAIILVSLISFVLALLMLLGKL